MKKKKILYYTPILNFPFISGGFMSIDINLKILNNVSDLIIIAGSHFEKINNRTKKYYKNLYGKKIIFINPKSNNETAEVINYFSKKYKIKNLWLDRIVESTYKILFLIKKKNPALFVVSHTDAVASEYIWRKAIVSKNILEKLKLFILSFSRKLKEKKILKLSNIITAVSNRDKKIFDSFYECKKKIFLFPNCLDTQKYKKKKLYKQNYIYMSGSFGAYGPNYHGATWFLEKVYPIVRNKISNIKILFAGKDANKNIRQNRNIKTIGEKEDLKPYLRKSSIMIVPIFFESGTRIKILEAGTMGIPIISTSIGAEGLKLSNNKEIIIANDHLIFAKKVIKLWKNYNLQKKLSKNIKKKIIKEISINRVKKQIIPILNKLY